MSRTALAWREGDAIGALALADNVAALVHLALSPG